MAPFGTIYSYPNNPRVLKVQHNPSIRLKEKPIAEWNKQTQAAANLNNLEITHAPFEMGKSNKSPSFLAKFPHGKVPAFETPDGKVRIIESDAITQYVAESGPASAQLLGRDAVERAMIRQWIVFAEGEVMSSVVRLAMWRVGLRGYDENMETAGMASLERAMGFLETHLINREKEGKKWLATEEKLSLADISVASALIWGFSMIIDAEMRPRFPTVLAWYDTTLASEGVKQAFGEKKFIEKRKAPPT